MNKELTINDLATKMDTLIGAVSTKVDTVNVRVDSLVTKVDGVIARVDDLAVKMDTGFKALDTKIGVLDSKIDTVEQRLTAKIDTDIEKLAIMVAGGFASVDKRFDRLESTVRVHGGRMGTLEERVNILEA